MRIRRVTLSRTLQRVVVVASMVYLACGIFTLSAIISQQASLRVILGYAIAWLGGLMIAVLILIFLFAERLAQAEDHSGAFSQ